MTRLHRRSFMAAVLGAAVPASALAAQRPGAASSTSGSGVASRRRGTPLDDGDVTDRPCGQPRRRGPTDQDPTDPAGRGRGPARLRATGLTDGDGGPQEDPVNFGRTGAPAMARAPQGSSGGCGRR